MSVKCRHHACTKKIDNPRFACNEHWYQLPWKLRVAIHQAWKLHYEDPTRISLFDQAKELWKA